MIDVPSVQTKIEMEKREELLSKHPYKIYQENSGRYCVYLPDKEFWLSYIAILDNNKNSSTYGKLLHLYNCEEGTGPLLFDSIKH